MTVAEPQTGVQDLKNFVNGHWVAAQGDKWLDVHSPGSGEVIARCPLSTPGDVEAAVEAAANAFKTWSLVPAGKRVEPLFKLVQILRDNEEKLARTLTREQGKSLPDARAEMKRMIENVEVACAVPVTQQGDKIMQVSAGIDGEVIRQPMGVFGMIAPFNFPAMVPFWFVPYAIATGNTYVLKPSEQVPMTMALTCELMEQIGLPPGVFNIVNGDRAVGEALVDHPKVAGISIVGSSAVVSKVHTRCAELGKRVQAMGGAKNHLLVMPDARMDEVVRNMVTSCYGCAGQRCMASSAIVAVGDETYDDVCKRFVEVSKTIAVGDPLDPQYADEVMFMGPVISGGAKQRILELIETGIKEGATLALDGRACRAPEGKEDGYYLGQTVFTDVQPGSTLHKTEIFGPVVVILKARNFDHALEIINGHEYGNGHSIYTQNGWYAREFKMRATAGMIGVNVGIPAPVAFLPFGGMKRSQFADIKAQGKEVVRFFTEDKVITERYWPEEG